MKAGIKYHVLRNSTFNQEIQYTMKALFYRYLFTITIRATMSTKKSIFRSNLFFRTAVVVPHNMKVKASVGVVTVVATHLHQKAMIYDLY